MTHFYRPFYSESHVQLPKVENTQSNSKKWKTYFEVYAMEWALFWVLQTNVGMHVQFTHTEKSSLIMAIITALLCSVIAEEIIFPWQITYCFSTSIYIYTQCMGTKWNSALFQNHKIQCAKMHVSRFVHLHFLENRIQHQLGQLWNF